MKSVARSQEHRSNRMREALAEANRLAGDAPLPHQDVGQALQEVIDRLYARWQLAVQQVDALDVDQLVVMTAYGPADHMWLKAEDALSNRLSKLLVEVERNDLAERMVRVEEAKAMLMVRAIQNAADKVGISRDQVRALGPAIRDQLAVLQGEPQRVAA